MQIIKSINCNVKNLQYFEMAETYCKEHDMSFSSFVLEAMKEKLRNEPIWEPRRSEISQLKKFMDVFNGISGPNKNDVAGKILIGELIDSGHFTEKQAIEYTQKAMHNGQIYERRSGIYAKP